MTPEWQDGEPANLAAAAADAGVWLGLIESCVQSGAWHFGRPDSMAKLQGCRAALRKHLDAEAKAPT
jgi:hypothetical protein